MHPWQGENCIAPQVRWPWLYLSVYPFSTLPPPCPSLLSMSISPGERSIALVYLHIPWTLQLATPWALLPLHTHAHLVSNIQRCLSVLNKIVNWRHLKAQRSWDILRPLLLCWLCTGRKISDNVWRICISSFLVAPTCHGPLWLSSVAVAV